MCRLDELMPQAGISVLGLWSRAAFIIQLAVSIFTLAVNKNANKKYYV